MSEVVVKYRRPLNKQQLESLHYLYWFRFCTSKQLAIVLKKSSQKVIQNKLQILEAQDIIGKRYDKDYKLAGRPAEYFITPKGARALEAANPEATNKWATKSLYKNKTVSDDFLKHCITTTDTAIKLRGLYGDKLKVFPRSYMAAYSSYPTWAPDLHLQQQTTAAGEPHHYFLDIWDNTKPFFVAVRKTQSYVQFKEMGDWLEDTPFPTILAVCHDERAQKKLNRQMRRILNDAWDDELVFATTTTAKLMQAAKPTDKIWSKIDADDNPEPVSLKGLTFVTS